MSTAQIVVSALLASALVLAPMAPARAQGGPAAGPAQGAPGGVPAQEVEARHDHAGLFLRLVTTAVWGRAAEVVEGSEVELSGPGVLVALSIGAGVSSRFVLFGEVYAVALPGPSAEVDEVSVENVSDTWYVLGGCGVGIAHYFPSEVHVALSIGPALAAGELLLTNGELTNVETDVHPAGRMVLGYEWRLSSNWGIGVLMDAVLVGGPDLDDDESPSVQFVSAGLGASITHN